jgi:CRISPR-associated DxTHG motif protein
LGTKSKIPLETVTRDLPNIPFHPISIPDGFNEKETWEIFSRLADHIDENDEIIFDVTHSFRSIPILALACLQYLRVLKHIEIKGIYYGCWEAKQDATPLPRAPIVNLTPFLDVMDWSTAVSSFVDKGDVADLGRLLRKETVPRLSASKGQDCEAKAMQQLGITLQNLAKAVSTCRGQDLAREKYFQQIRTQLSGFKSFENTVPAFQPLLSLVEQKLASLECAHDLPEDVRMGIDAVNWAIEHGLLQQAYTLLQETVLSHLCRVCGIDPLDRKNRHDVGGALQMVKRNDEKAEMDDIPPEIIQGVKKFARTELPGLFDKVSKRRNDFNHAGMNNCPAKADTFGNEITTLRDDLLNCLFRK